MLHKFHHILINIGFRNFFFLLLLKISSLKRTFLFIDSNIKLSLIYPMAIHIWITKKFLKVYTFL